METFLSRLWQHMNKVRRTIRATVDKTTARTIFNKLSLDGCECFAVLGDVKGGEALEENDLKDVERVATCGTDVVADPRKILTLRVSSSVLCSSVADNPMSIKPGTRFRGTLPLKDRLLGSKASHAEALPRLAITMTSPVRSILRLIV